MIDISEMYCVNCGTKGIPIPRRINHKKGHLKKLFCIKCQKEWNHVEISPHSNYTYEDFQLELKYHNFDQNGNRILEYSKFKNQLIKKGEIK